MKINMALCFSDKTGKYFINPYITLLSVFKNTNHSIIVHILHDSTIEYGKKYLQELCHSYGHEIYFHRINNAFDTVTSRALTKVFDISTTYRYYVHEFIKSEKAIYLDCDIIVNRDIGDLYAAPLGDRLFAGVLDIGFWRKGKPVKGDKDHIEYFKLKLETNINTGVMLMNLDKLREISGNSNIFVQKAMAAIKDGIELDYPGQLIVTSVAAMVHDGVLMLDQRFNLFHKALNLGLNDLQDTIFHYLSKPDKEFFPAHLLFWKYYAMSPFADDMFERISSAYTSEAMEFVQDYASKPKHRRHARELLKYGMAGMLLRAVARMFGIIKK